MKMVRQPEAMAQWWRGIDESGIDVVVANGRLTEDRGSINTFQ